LTPEIVAAAATVTGLLTYRLTGFFTRFFTKRGMTGVDIHKLDKPVRAEMGGLGILLSLLAGSAVLMAFDGQRSVIFLSAMAAVAFTGLIGLADDHFDLRQRYKAILIAVVSFPLSYSLLGDTGVTFPFIGHIPFGILTSIVIVPLALTTSANFANMLAGFNGLEAGIASISIGTLTFLAAATGMWEGAALGTLLLFAYLGFLALNWYPSKIFPGDSGTLMFGAGLITIGLISHLEFAAIVLSFPAAFDFTLKLLSKRPFAQRKLLGNTSVKQDGTLTPPHYPALAHAFMIVAPTTEKSLVRWILLMEGLYACLAVALTFLPL
jgi:UDP-N-acetylglucosamine--dolichyl-phosphate N-acetylglucosaminephosphotransferase